MKRDCSVIVFAKAPVPGYAKTRLARVLGEEAAARLAERMLSAAISRALEADVGPVELCCAPDASHPRFHQLADDHGIALAEQGEGDLGARMRHAFARHLSSRPRVLLIGTDAPGLDAARLRAAALALRDAPCVFVPARDGGYALVGLDRPLPTLFDDIAWSTSQVMRQTRERIAALGVGSVELPAVHDIDEPEDLAHLPQEWLK